MSTWSRNSRRIVPISRSTNGWDTGIRDRPIAARSPWQNPFRRECLDHVLIFGEQHLRRVLTLYALYYNETRTHLGLAKDAPRRRAVQRYGDIVTTPVLCGLHHCYARI
jgi:hypothetical protein